MKYICLGYYDETQWATIPESERNQHMDACFAYDEVLKKNGHFAGGEALQGANSAATLRWKDGKVSVTDGPFATRSSWVESSCSRRRTWTTPSS
jgi:hypothetical protein